MRKHAPFDHCLRAAQHCDTRDSLLDVARTFVMERREVVPTDPVTDDEVVRTVESVWQKTQAGENWFGRGGRAVFPPTRVPRATARIPGASLFPAVVRRASRNHSLVLTTRAARAL